MPLNIKAYGELLAINLRKEGKDDDRVIAVDLKVSMLIDIRNLDVLTGEDFPILEDMFYTSEGNPKFWSITKIDFESEFAGHIAKIGQMVFGDCRVNKFSVGLKDERMARLTFMIHAKPQPDQVAKVAKLLGEDITIAIESHPDLFENKDKGDNKPNESNGELH